MEKHAKIYWMMRQFIVHFNTENSKKKNETQNENRRKWAETL